MDSINSTEGSEGSIGIFSTDAALVVRSWDEWLVRATSIPADNACGRPLWELFPELEERGLLARLREVIEAGVVHVLAPAFHHYFIPCSPLNPARHFTRMQQHVTIAPLREDAHIVGALVSIEDVTVRLERRKDLVEQLAGPDENMRLQAAEALASDDALDPAQTLVGALGDSSWRVRRVAVGGLAKHGGPEAVTELLRALKSEHSNPSVLNSALQVLSMMNLDTLTPLLDFLSGPDTDLRIYAALALGEMGDNRAVPALIRALEDPGTNVRYHAIESLGKLRSDEAVDALCAIALSRDFFLAFPCLDALVLIGNSSAASRIIPLLEDELLSEAAAEALGKLGDQDSVPFLTALLNRPGASAGVVVRALASLHDRFQRLYGEGDYIADLSRRGISAAGASNALAALDALSGSGAEPDSTDIRALALVLGWIGGDAVERALTRLLGHPKARREVVEALVRYGNRVTDLLIEHLRDEDVDTRKAAVIALGRIGDPRSVAALVELLREDEELMIVVSGALAKIGDRRAFEGLLSCLGHCDAAVRQAVVAALNSLGHPDMPRRMMDLLVDQDARIRESAVKIAGYFGYPECIDLLFERCLDADELVRGAAVEHIAYLEDERALSVLALAFRNETPRIRAAAARAFSHIESRYSLPYLTGALRDTDPWVRYFTARTLSRMEPLKCGTGSSERPEIQEWSEALELLAGLARSDPANHVRITAMEALGRLGGVRSVSLLAPLVEEDDEDLARAALSSLGSIDHPDALQPLLAALRSSHPSRRSSAIQALAKRPGPDTVGALQWVVSSDMSQRVIDAGIEALAHLSTPEAVTALISLAGEPKHREACVKALSQLGEPSIDWIARGLSDSRASVRSATIEALARMKHSRATEKITAALDDPEASVRMEAVVALRQLGTRQAEARLLEMSRSDLDINVRRAAKK